MRFYCGGNEWAERILQRFCESISVISPCDTVGRANELYKELSRVGNGEIHFTAGTNFKWNTVIRIKVAYLGICPPFDCHLYGLVDEINLAMERRFVAGGAIKQLSKYGNVLCFKCITTCAEQVECLSVHEEDRLLALMNDKLCQ